MGEFRMPSLGADMERGTLLEWLVAPGDEVAKGDIVAVVDTDKSDIEVEVFESGVVTELLVAVGEEVPVGTPLARIEPTSASGSSTPGAPGSRGSVSGNGEPVPPGSLGAGPPRSASVPVPPTARTRASPLARRRAAAHELDLAAVSGSGPGGAVLAADLAGVTPPTPEDGVRRALARAMARSKREIPHYYLETTIDLGEALAWLREHNGSRPVSQRVLPVAMLLRATALAAAEHPELNGYWVDGHRPSDAVHLGVAIALRRGGLVAPAILDAQLRPLDDLMAALRDVTKRARAGRLRQREWTSATITVTNLGDLGVRRVFGVVNPPQLAMVGFGSRHDAVVAVEGQATVRPVVHATLAADHRASDGMQGAGFLSAIDRRLQDPGGLALPEAEHHDAHPHP